MGFHTKIPINSDNNLWNFEIGFFDWVIELSKLNQTWHDASPEYIESKIEKVLAIACPWEESDFCM